MPKYLEFVNSANRESYSNSSSDFTCSLSQSFQKVKSIKLIGYYIANTIYTINDYNYQLTYVENAGTDSITISIPKKVYTTSQLATELGTLMTANTLNAITYTVTYDTQTYKFTFTASTSDFYFDYTHLTYGCFRELGFDVNYTGTASSSVTSSNMVRLDNNFILMETDLSNDIKGSNTGLGTCSFILQLPSIGTSDFFNTEVIQHTLKTGKSQFNKIKIKLIDTSNRTINFNGSNNIFIFEIEAE